MFKRRVHVRRSVLSTSLIIPLISKHFLLSKICIQALLIQKTTTFRKRKPRLTRVRRRHLSVTSCIIRIIHSNLALRYLLSINLLRFLFPFICSHLQVSSRFRQIRWNVNTFLQTQSIFKFCCHMPLVSRYLQAPR